MNSGRFLFTVALVLMIGVAVDAKKRAAPNSKENKKHGKNKELWASCLKPEFFNGTDTDAAMVLRTKIQNSSMTCMQNIGMDISKLPMMNGTGSSAEMNNAPRTHGDKKKHGLKGKMAGQEGCLAACVLNKLELLSTDNTTFSTTAFNTLAESLVKPEFKDQFVTEFNACLTKKEINVTALKMGTECDDMKTIKKCFKKVMKKGCGNKAAASSESTSSSAEADENDDDSNSKSNSDFQE